MPFPFGVTPQGFSRKTTQEILADIKARQRANISTNLDLSTATPWGQNNGIFADELAAAWEALEVCYHAFDPDQAEDFLQTSLGKLTGTERRAASFSGVTLTCNLDAGVTLVSDTHYAAVDGDSTSLWTPLEDYVAPFGGSQGVWFRAENPGKVSAIAGAITVVHTSVAGWSGVSNLGDAVEGHEIDSDATLRERRENQLTATGSATTKAIASDVLDVDGVESCAVTENDSDATVNGVPPHAVHVLVFDGEAPAADNNAIAQAIWDSKAGGIYAHGATSGIATDEVTGATFAVWFDRPTQVPIYLALTGIKGPNWADLGGETGFKSYLVSELKAVHGAGQDVQYRLADSLGLYFGGLRRGVRGVTAFAMGTAPGPTGTTDIAIGDGALATFDSANISVTMS